MIKRLSALLMVIVLLFSFGSTSYACDENQSNDYVTQILFGDRAYSRANDDNTKMLMSALYLCSEQADNLGQDKINYLKQKKVPGVPALKDINVKNADLLEFSHNYWGYEYPASKKIRSNRKKVLRNTVNKVFDFGFVNNIFGSNKGKCESFAAMLYYSHILADYLAADSSDTAVVFDDGLSIPSYSGKPYCEINGNKPKFSSYDISRANTNTYLYSGLDNYGRAGSVLAVVGPDTLADASNKSVRDIDLPGWKQNKYERISGNQSAELYNRSHLLARSMGGANEKYNLVIGTNYMNQYVNKKDKEGGMKYFEEEVILEYVKRTGNHVLYRVTPRFKGNNKVCYGVQMEAFSLEDSGQGVSFNVYCYNVQPGIGINYVTGDNWQSDTITNAKNTIPFAVYNAGDNNPDLIYEMNIHLKVLFDIPNNSSEYTSMMNEINAVANEARSVANSFDNEANKYVKTKKCQYEYFKVLKRHVPRLLEKEDFFNKTFK